MVFDVIHEELDTVKALVREKMEHAVELKVPLIVEMNNAKIHLVESKKVISTDRAVLKCNQNLISIPGDYANYSGQEPTNGSNMEIML